ncbi:MAG: pyrroline-5-carboxylate reductase [Wenzhouxiangella sp.]|nr:MAG: pyrroline-5-carboxylate reductase [Wenzhouxiangella sp.]
MTHFTLSFIGGGNMARALVGGLVAAGHAADSITVADPDAGQRAALADDLGIQPVADNADAARAKRVVVLAVKPQIIDQVLKDIASHLDAQTVVISVAAGVTLATLEAALGRERALVRAMPNTPALFGAGMTGLVANSAAGSEDRDLAGHVFSAAGATAWIEDEALMDVITAVSGSGPAYFFSLTEHLARAGAEAGLAPELAARLARQTAVGAGVMLGRSELDAGELRARVTSPGGTTAAALEQFASDGFERIIDRAVAAAVRRGRELGAG